MTRHALRPCHLFAAMVVAIVIATPIEPLDAPIVDAGSRTRGCFILARWHNHYRHVAGPVNVECFGPHSWDGNRGNWGVDSLVSRPIDGFQFAGWDLKDGWRTWQSCTREHRRPDYRHYNDPATGYTTQKADPDNDRAYGYDTDRGPARTSCRTVNRGVYTYINNHMKLYELDWPDRNDHVADLIYGNINVPVTCSGSWNCSGSSAWISPDPLESSTNASAKLQIRVHLF